MGNLSNEAPAALAARRIDGFSPSPVCTLSRPHTIHGRGCRSTAMRAPFFTYVLHGSFVERAGHHVRQCSRGAVIFHDQESHTNEVSGAGTVSFNVELDPELWRELTDGDRRRHVPCGPRGGR